MDLTDQIYTAVYVHTFYSITRVFIKCVFKSIALALKGRHLFCTSKCDLLGQQKMILAFALHVFCK